MSKKNIRSQYIKNLMADKESLEGTLKESTKESLKNILEEGLKKDLRQILSEAEDEDSYEEEEVETDDSVDTETPENSEETDTEVEDTAETDDAEVEGETEDAEMDADAEGSEMADGEEVWGDLEQYKDEDGEYDLTGMGNEDVIKVLKVMKPSDGVRVVQNDNGSVTLTDDETEKEYIIDLDGSFGGEDMEDDEFDGMNENVGYTDNYQNKTAMTTPSNNEPADSKNTYSMDGGVPTGTEKPFAGKGDNSPYNEVTEGCEFEIETDDEDCEDCEKVDENMTVANGAQANGTCKTHGTDNSTRPVARNGSVAGRKVKGTADARYSNAQMENIMRKANAIFNENKQLKSIAKKITEKLTEATVINHSLGKIIKLVTENTTTRDEKIDIVKRFNEVKNINESAQLYNTIENELKSVNRINANIDNNVQIAESKERNNIVETSIYKSEDLSETLDLMKRMENL